MNLLLRLVLFNFLIVTNAQYSFGDTQSALEVREKTKEYLSSHKQLLKAITEVYDGYDLLNESLQSFKNTKTGYGTVDSPEDWIKARRKINSAKSCSKFVAYSIENGRRIFKIVRKEISNYKDAIGINELHDFKVLMNRKYRKAIQKGINEVPFEESYKLCTFNVDTKTIDLVIKNYAEYKK